MKRALAVLALSAAACSGAAAATFDWTGVYVGSTAGAASGSYQQRDSHGVLGAQVPVFGFIAGATIGADVMHGNLVLGVVADWQTGPRGSTALGGGAYPCTVVGSPCDVNIRSYWTARGRVGIAVENWMFYGTAGVAGGYATGGIRNTAFAGAGHASGWVAGIGGEYGFVASPSWSVQAEAIRVSLSPLTFGEAGPSNPYSATGSFNVVRFGVSYRFNAK